tara:strand:+ start:159 stop:1016 length:858 start_codon:yes stop_codon:yes gene_type:complete
MEVITLVKDFQDFLKKMRQNQESLGFVPTMGALHQGHTSLIDASRTGGNSTIVSIFLNPLQFEPSEDLETYPKDLERDIAICQAQGADVVFCPSYEEIYQSGEANSISPGKIAEIFEGRIRPSHFSGVATVLLRLFGIVGASSAYFGEKDFQQIVVVKNLVKEFRLPIEIIPCPTIREKDGLALSSRNVYLSLEERSEAPVLYRALSAAAKEIVRGEQDTKYLSSLVESIIKKESKGRLDYVGIVYEETFASPTCLDQSGKSVRILIACTFGEARLIDNIGVVIP